VSRRARARRQLPDAVFGPDEPDSHIAFALAQTGEKCGQEFPARQAGDARSMAVVEQRMTLRQQEALFRNDRLHINAFLS